MRRCAFALLVALLWPIACLAHEVRPAYLELRETRSGEFSVLWKTPMRGDVRLALEPAVFRRGHRDPAGDHTHAARGRGADVDHSRASAARADGADRRTGGDDDRRPRSDRVRRRQHVDAAADARAAGGDDPRDATSALAVAGVYLKLGVEHILLGHRSSAVRAGAAARHARELASGEDGHGVHGGAQHHARGWRRSGSSTYRSAGRGGDRAEHRVRRRRDRPRPAGPHGITARAPWIVAFAFGLLHGFGFAGRAERDRSAARAHPAGACCSSTSAWSWASCCSSRAVLAVVALLRRVRIRDCRAGLSSRRLTPSAASRCSG